jgi:hypothetical protein
MMTPKPHEPDSDRPGSINYAPVLKILRRDFVVCWASIVDAFKPVTDPYTGSYTTEYLPDIHDQSIVEHVCLS